MNGRIYKRDGREDKFSVQKIEAALARAFSDAGEENGAQKAHDVAQDILREMESNAALAEPTVEQVQALVEKKLTEQGFLGVAKAYTRCYARRCRARERHTRLMKIYEDITFKDASQTDMKRENANVNGDTAMGAMLKYGSEGAKQFNDMYVLKPEHARAHREGDIHIHDMDFLTLTTTCTQIDLLHLFDGGFSTGHGMMREPQDILSYAALATVAIQSNQNDQHGGQSICNFDYGMAPGVKKTFAKCYRKHMAGALELLVDDVDADAAEALSAEVIRTARDESGFEPSLQEQEAFGEAAARALRRHTTPENAGRIVRYAYTHACKETERRTYQAMEAFIHNLNTMHSRAGAQTPFSSINYGMDTSPEGRMVMRNVLLATEAGLGEGETPIFPIQIFRVKEGVNYRPGEPNYDLFKLAMRVSAKRLFPNFSFVDAPFNLRYYRPGRPETEIAYMGCRTRVIGNVFDRENEVCNRRGNLSFTSINLPRLAILAQGSLERFYRMLDERMDLVIDQLNERFEIQARRHVYNYPFLMGERVWLGSENLGWNDEVREALKHGTLSVGFIGLAETLKALIGVHHGQSAEAQRLGLEIIGRMRKRLDEESARTRMNYTLLATPAEGLSGRFVRIDRERFGVIPGVTDREYYTNSFHVPVYFPISAFEKIRLEGPYHALTNAGHISYVELDGDPSRNLEAFEAIVRAMHDAGVGYGSINHPIDRDPVCGYSGIIGDTCPHCGRKDEEVHFERIRRITGYLVGTLDRFNDAKRAEERERVKHGVQAAQER